MQVKERYLWAWASSKGLLLVYRLILYKSWFFKNTTDASLYVLLENGKYVIIVLYVDALIVIGDNNINIH